MVIRTLALLAVLAACGGPRDGAKRIDPPPTIMSPIGGSTALMPIAWMRGRWLAPNGGIEHWTPTAGAFYGVALHPDGNFEIMVIDDAPGPGKADGVLRFYAMPGGAAATEFTQQTIEKRTAVFANPAHDFPKTITYRLDDKDVLHAEAAGDGHPAQTFTFTSVPSFEPAPELEALDRARSNEPVESGIAGNQGFTVGSMPASKTSYATVWAKQADGSWQVRFETTRPIND